MLRRALIIVMTVMFCVGFVGVSFASEPGNKRKGKYTYRKVYKACHARGAVEAPKPTVNPDAHTQAEWTQIFEENRFDEFGCNDEWANLSDEQLLDIYSYLHAHASDSPTPAKCK